MERLSVAKPIFVVLKFLWIGVALVFIFWANLVVKSLVVKVLYIVLALLASLIVQNGFDWFRESLLYFLAWTLFPFISLDMWGQST